MKPAENRKLIDDLKIQADLIAWPKPRLDGDRVRHQPIPHYVPKQEPINHDVEVMDLDTGELRQQKLNRGLVTYFNNVNYQFRRRHWSAQVQLLSELKTETQITPTATESATHAPNSDLAPHPQDKIKTVFTTGLFELIDLRYGLKAKPEFFVYYDQIIRNIANIAAIEVEHLSDGFYGFTQKSVSFSTGGR